jgi:micrococcal nuclease
MKIRLAGINAPEMNTVEGRKLKAELITLLEDKTVTLLTVKDKQEKYGRYLGIIVKDKQNINEWLVEQKMAVRYNV